MRVEEIFKLIDSLLGLEKLSNISVLIISCALVFTITLYVLYTATKPKQNYRGMLSEHSNDSYRTSLLLMLYVCVMILMSLGFIQSFTMYYISTSLAIALTTYIATSALAYLWLDKQKESSRLCLLYTSSLLFAFFFSSKVMLNGVEASETTADTLQIFFEGKFRFSRHAGWYDLAPVDAILKNFLLSILGIDNPYDPATTTLMYYVLAISVVTYTFAFVKKLPGNFIKNSILAILLLSIHPYALLTVMSSPPHNFSLAFSVLAIMLVAKVIYTTNVSSINYETILLLFTILTTSAILAHPMSMAIPIYLLVSLIYLKVLHKHNKNARFILFLLLIGVAVFSLKSMYTPVPRGAMGLIREIIEGITALVTGKSRDIVVFHGSPLPKSALFPYAAFPGFMVAIFLNEVIKLLRGRRADMHTILVLGVVLALTIAAIATNFVAPSSRYLGRPAIVLGSFQILVYLIHLTYKPAYPRPSKALVVLLGIMCLTSILSPSAMVEHYNVFTGGRWPRIENFILSRYLIDNVNPEYVVSVFYMMDKAKLNIYLAPDILYYGHPYHHIEVLLTEKFLIPGIINARTYWDFYGGRLFLKYASNIDFSKISNENVIFSGWKWIMTWIH